MVRRSRPPDHSSPYLLAFPSQGDIGCNALRIIGHVSAIVERFKEKPMSSDSIYRTRTADQMNHREDSPSALVSYVCRHGSFRREWLSTMVCHWFRSTIADTQVFDNC
jgi:hypothetical protein